MPIRPEKRKFYPWHWRHTRRVVLALAGHACQGSTRDPMCRAPNGLAHPDFFPKVTRLTVAHLDHDPTNNAVENVVAMCQWCHLHHDRGEHALTRRQTRAAETGQGTMPWDHSLDHLDILDEVA